MMSDDRILQILDDVSITRPTELAIAFARAVCKEQRAEDVRKLRSRFCEGEADYSHFWKLTAP